MSRSSPVYQMDPPAVILDFDGVIVNSLRAHLLAWEKACSIIFHKPLSRPERMAQYATRTIASILAKEFGDPSLAKDLADTKERLLLEHDLEVPLLGGVNYFLDEMHRLGIPLAIASNSRSDYVLGLLEKYKLRTYFKTILCGDQVRLPKPNPDMFWECARSLGIADRQERQKILGFEDSPHGVGAIIKAGMLPFGITSQVPREDLMSCGALDTFPDLGAALVLFRGCLA